MSSGNQRYLNNTDWIIICAGWAAAQVILYTIYGINSREEALTHISFAESLINGTARIDLHRLWYSGYTALLVAIKKAGLPYQSMYVVQLMLSFVAVVCFVKIVSSWSASRVTCLLSGLMYSTCFLIHQWTNYIFTDAVFSFLLVIAIYFLINQDKSRFNKVAFWFLLIILPFFRPVGFLFLIVACLHWLFFFKKENVKKILLATVYLTILLVMVYQSIAVSEGYFYPYNNLDAEIICGRPGELLQYQVVPYTKDSKIVQYFWNNPELTVRLFTWRFYKTFSMTRSYFSAGHNFVIATACIIYYVLALTGVVYLIRRKLRDRYFLLAGCLVFCIPSVVFCVEWHGRTSLPVLCFVLLLSSIGIDRLVNRHDTILLR